MYFPVVLCCLCAVVSLCSASVLLFVCFAVLFSCKLNWTCKLCLCVLVALVVVSVVLFLRLRFVVIARLIVHVGCCVFLCVVFSCGVVLPAVYVLFVLVSPLCCVSLFLRVMCLLAVQL